MGTDGWLPYIKTKVFRTKKVGSKIGIVPAHFEISPCLLVKEELVAKL